MKMNPRLRDLEKRVAKAETCATPQDHGRMLEQAIHETRLLLFAMSGVADANESAGAADFECTLAACSPPVVRVVREIMGMKTFSPDYCKELSTRLKPLNPADIKIIAAYRERAMARDFKRRNKPLPQRHQITPVDMGTKMDRREL